MEKLTDKTKTPVTDEQQYRGVDINAADHDKVNDRLVKQDIKIRNSNPHSQGI